MLKDRRKTEKMLIKSGLAKKSDLFFTYKDGFDVSILKKDNIETMFFFKDEPKKFVTMTKPVVKKDQSKINLINDSYSNIHASYKKDKVMLTMATTTDIINQYQFGLKLIKSF